MGTAFSACAPLAHEAAPSPEEAQGVTTASEYLQALRRSTHPLSQLLATIEESDLVLCTTGQQLVDEHTCIQDCTTLLADDEHPMAAAIIFLLTLLACKCFPTLIASTHTARYMLTHVRRQVWAYPDLVDHRDVPCTTLVDFQFYDPPADVHTHTLRNAGAAFQT